MLYNQALIVDDSKLARVTLKKKLESLGLEVSMVDSASEAYEAISESCPDIIFMDHLMPDVDGFEATQHIRQMPGFETLPVIMCTGKEHDGYLEEARSIGANQILSKPPVDEQLNQILETDFGATEPAGETAEISAESMPDVPDAAAEEDLPLADNVDELEETMDEYQGDAQDWMPESEAAGSFDLEGVDVDEPAFDDESTPDVDELMSAIDAAMPDSLKDEKPEEPAPLPDVDEEDDEDDEELFSDSYGFDDDTPDDQRIPLPETETSEDFEQELMQALDEAPSNEAEQAGFEEQAEELIVETSVADLPGYDETEEASEAPTLKAPAIDIDEPRFSDETGMDDDDDADDVPILVETHADQANIPMATAAPVAAESPASPASHEQILDEEHIRDICRAVFEKETQALLASLESGSDYQEGAISSGQLDKLLEAKTPQMMKELNMMVSKQLDDVIDAVEGKTVQHVSDVIERDIQGILELKMNVVLSERFSDIETSLEELEKKLTEQVTEIVKQAGSANEFLEIDSPLVLEQPSRNNSMSDQLVDLYDRQIHYDKKLLAAHIIAGVSLGFGLIATAGMVYLFFA